VTDAKHWTVVELTELYADGLASKRKLRVALLAGLRVPRPGRVADLVSQATAWAADWDGFAAAESVPGWAADAASASALDAERAASGGRQNPRQLHRVSASARNAQCAVQVSLLRCIIGNPFRPPPPVSPAWLTWNNGAVRRLAEAAYAERQLPSGHLDQARLGVLADALEDAGCGDADLLGHLRGPGPHVRGCHVLDLLLGKW
jgi:hypothetical protein